jgi:hypothetical protein
VEYLLYRGSSEGQPFHRAPDFTESDHVPESEFVEWELRHRLLLGDDWSGDGRPDLLRVGAHDRGTRLEVLPGRTGGGKAGFADSPSAVAETPLGVKNRQCWRLSPDEPAVICRTETGAVIFAGR